MSLSDYDLLHESIHLITEKDVNLTAKFYERFFARHPQIRDLFGPNSIPVQEDMLTETLVSAADDLNGVAWIESNMQVLGVKHFKTEVTDEMYDWWADCVMETLAELSDGHWSPRLERLWRCQIQRLCDLMREAAREAETS